LCGDTDFTCTEAEEIKTRQKQLEGFEMWCWRKMEKISWTDHVRNEEVLLRVNEQRKRKANWIGHILRKTALYDRLFKER
jgi:hypothetical protein